MEGAYPSQNLPGELTMRVKGLLLCLFAVLLTGGFTGLYSQSAIPSSQSTITAADASAPPVIPSPPGAVVKVVTDEYFGIKVADPYRYMEGLKDPQVQAWFKAQNDYTRAVLARIPGRTALLARIKELDESELAFVNSAHLMPDGRIFYMKRLASEEVGKLYMREGWDGTDKLLFDPAKFEAGNAHYSINYISPSFDGRYVGVGVSQGGSEDAVLRVVDTTTGRETGDAIDRAWWGSPGWLPDGRSFVYNRLQKLGPNSPPTDRELNSRTYLHVLGRDPEKDPLVFGSGLPGVQIEPTDLPFVATFPGSSYVIGLNVHGAKNEVTLYVAPLESLTRSSISWKKLCDVEDDVTRFDVHGDDLYLQSHKNASRYKVLHTSLSNPDVARAEVVIPSGEAVVRNIVAASDALYVQELDGGIGRLVRLPYTDNKAEQVPLPFNGSLSIVATDHRISGVAMYLASWANAGGYYFYDLGTKQVIAKKLQPVGPYDKPADVESVEVKVKSYDGTLVPLSIVRKNGLALDGSHPTRLIGYGAYGITLDTYFDPTTLAWLEQGGVYAIAHVRGGGEYGEDWHLAAKGLTKPNTWKDMIACAQYLIDQKYTSSAHLAIEGGSAGGITIGRSITERPDLFAVAIDEVPVSDVVRVEFSPNGPPNIAEFGTVKTQDGFKGLYEMSAYAHVKDGTAYPAVMVTTGFNDPRVASWQPGKMAARLQAATTSGKPVLLRVDYDAGHGIGSTKTQGQIEKADEWSFELWQFGAAGFQPQK
jgi:prolyl oligopeptidase